MATFSAWPPFIVCVYIIRRAKSDQLNVSLPLLSWLAGYFFTSLFADSLGLILAEKGINNHWVIHTFLLLQFPLILMIYRHAFSRVRDWWLITLGAAFIVFKVVDWILWYPDFMPTMLFTSAAATLLNAHYFWLLPQLTFPAKETLTFWVYSGFLMYFTCGLVLFATADTILSSKETYYVWGFHAVLGIAKVAFVTVGMLRVRPTMRVS